MALKFCTRRPSYGRANSRNVTRRRKDDAVSNDIEHYSDPQDATVARFLMNNNGDELTDTLVAALEDAFRILKKEWASRAMH